MSGQTNLITVPNIVEDRDKLDDVDKGKKTSLEGFCKLIAKKLNWEKNTKGDLYQKLYYNNYDHKASNEDDLYFDGPTFKNLIDEKDQYKLNFLDHMHLSDKAIQSKIDSETGQIAIPFIVNARDEIRVNLVALLQDIQYNEDTTPFKHIYEPDSGDGTDSTPKTLYVPNDFIKNFQKIKKDLENEGIPVSDDKNDNPLILTTWHFRHPTKKSNRVLFRHQLHFTIKDDNTINLDLYHNVPSRRVHDQKAINIGAMIIRSQEYTDHKLFSHEIQHIDETPMSNQKTNFEQGIQEKVFNKFKVRFVFKAFSSALTPKEIKNKPEIEKKVEHFTESIKKIKEENEKQKLEIVGGKNKTNKNKKKLKKRKQTKKSRGGYANKSNPVPENL